MFIAHLPSGYLLAQGFNSGRFKGVVPVALLGSIFPDLDLIYFYTIDQRQHHHHSYWIHYPIIWAGLLLVSAIWLAFSRESRAALLSLVFSLGGFLHIILDSLVGDIQWLAPFSYKFYALAKVEAVYKPWWLNFLLHWSFVAELIIVVLAVVVFFRNRRRKKLGG